jgi:hypothetical protein
MTSACPCEVLISVSVVELVPLLLLLLREATGTKDGSFDPFFKNSFVGVLVGKPTFSKLKSDCDCCCGCLIFSLSLLLSNDVFLVSEDDTECEDEEVEEELALFFLMEDDNLGNLAADNGAFEVMVLPPSDALSDIDEDAPLVEVPPTREEEDSIGDDAPDEGADLR